MNDLLTTEELAARWRMEDTETVCAMIRRGELPASKIGKRYLIESTTVLQFEADKKETTCRSINAVKSGGVAGASLANRQLLKALARATKKPRKNGTTNAPPSFGDSEGSENVLALHSRKPRSNGGSGTRNTSAPHNLTL